MNRRRILWPLVVANENDASLNKPPSVHSPSAWRVVFTRVYQVASDKDIATDPRWEEFLFTDKKTGEGWRALRYVRLARRLVKRYNFT